MASLQDQLLKAGLVDKTKAGKVKKDKHKQLKQQPKGRLEEDETKRLARLAREEKAARDREINRHRQAELERRAIHAQIQQLVSSNRVDRRGGEAAYQFSDEGKIKKLYVTEKLHQQLVKGHLAIVSVDSGYELVPAGVADKIAERDARLVVVNNRRVDDGVDVDDPYAEFQIPDDLMW